MRTRLSLLFCAGLLASALPARSQFYVQRNLVSDGAVATEQPPDPHLVNAWGLVSSATSPWWVANNGSATATLYDGAGVRRPIVVSIPGSPTGIVFNGGTGFVVKSGSASGSARFIFATEDGAIAGWNPAVPPPSTSMQAFIGVDASSRGAVYKGLAIDSATAGKFLYATDFHNGVVDMYDSSWNLVGSFTDHGVTLGYAPFGIQNVAGTLYVTFAKQNAAKHDDVPGIGHGFVDAFDLSGNLLRRVASRGLLNSPWGIALAPAGFGTFSGDLLIGNFGDGRINAFDPTRVHTNEAFQRRGQMRATDCSRLTIDGLWSLQFGNGTGSGPITALYFTAGPDSETHGLFGNLVPAAAPPSCDADDNGGDED